MSGYGMSFYDYMHAGEYEDEQHRARAVGSDRDRYYVDTTPNSRGLHDVTRQQQEAHQRELELQQQQELESERQEARVAALRACLTHGAPLDAVRLLCEELSVSYASVVGDTACGVPQTSLNTLETDKDDDMKQNEMIESKFLKQDDVPEDKLVTVQAIKKENMANPDQPPEYKWTVKFEELAKPMAMNSTNLKRMFKYCGEDSDDWIGKKVVVYTDPDVEFKGEIVGGLRIRQARRPGAPPRQQTEDFDPSIPF